jgi:hypothetical protein
MRALLGALLVSSTAFAGHIADDVLVLQSGDGKTQIYWDRAVQQRGRQLTGIKMPDTVVYTQAVLKEPSDVRTDEGLLFDCPAHKYAVSWVVKHEPRKEDREWSFSNGDGPLDWEALEPGTLPAILYPLVCK